MEFLREKSFSGRCARATGRERHACIGPEFFLLPYFHLLDARFVLVLELIY